MIFNDLKQDLKEITDSALDIADKLIMGQKPKAPLPLLDLSNFRVESKQILTDIDFLRFSAKEYGFILGLSNSWGINARSKHLVDEAVFEFIKQKTSVADYKELLALLEIKGLELAEKLLWYRCLKNGFPFVSFVVAGSFLEGCKVFTENIEIVKIIKKASRRPKNGKQKA